MRKVEDILLYFSLKYNGDFHKIYHALKTKEKVSQEQIHDAKTQIKSKYTTIISKDYPASLKSIMCPPFVLYYYGDLSLLDHYCIGVIGSRHPNQYGYAITETMVRKLVEHKMTVISGMAIGIDSAAHQSALKYSGHTVAVLGSGIDYCYPHSNQKIYHQLKNNHLVISEYPNDVTPQSHHFPVRNRIIAGLSASILVTQANQRSGTMITVGYALDQGKDIYCVPSRIYDPRGCNILIQQGAKLVLDINDIIEDLEMRLTK